MCVTVPHPRTTIPFPYTTLFRSPMVIAGSPARSIVPAAGLLFRVAAGDGDAVSRPRHHLGADHRSPRSEEHTSELQSPCNLVCRLLLEKKNTKKATRVTRSMHAE